MHSLLGKYCAGNFSSKWVLSWVMRPCVVDTVEVGEV